MAKDPVTPPEDSAPPAWMADFLKAVQGLNTSGGLDAAAVARIASEAAVAASQKVRDQWWDDTNFPDVSSFNPLGERDHPRPELDGEIYWVGTRLTKDELTREEILALNQLRPGYYHRGQWVVTDLAPGSGSRKYLVMFPTMDAGMRADLPSLLAMVEEMNRARMAVPA
jgi:hypothetical protein